MKWHESTRNDMKWHGSTRGDRVAPGASVTFPLCGGVTQVTRACFPDHTRWVLLLSLPRNLATHSLASSCSHGPMLPFGKISNFQNSQDSQILGYQNGIDSWDLLEASREVTRTCGAAQWADRPRRAAHNMLVSLGWHPHMLGRSQGHLEQPCRRLYFRVLSCHFMYRRVNDFIH